MSFDNPTIPEFKSYFFRDFPYGTTLDTVTDADISRGLTDSDAFVNADFFGSQAQYSIGFLLLAAHFMVMSLRASSQGISGQYDWLVSSKGVGSVSTGISIPQRIMDNPELAMLSQTPYGAKYLMIVIPQLSGQMFTVEGTTLP